MSEAPDSVSQKVKLGKELDVVEVDEPVGSVLTEDDRLRVLEDLQWLAMMWLSTWASRDRSSSISSRSVRLASSY